MQNNNQPNQNQKKEIKLADNIPGGEYANNMQTMFNRDEFQMIFMNILAGSGRVSAKVISSPGHFKRMVKAVEGALKLYEEKFGEIKEAEGPENKEIGFRG
ncbi:DUF3467 domain-containing protein [Candidatus Falkowbacteria bacterium]|nr:DUF3467 domain-containing protein [Candidatus Falkowbacteria bacterium]